MSTITVVLPDEDLAFLRRFSETQGTSAEELLASQARSLRAQLERPIPPEIVAASGIIQGDIDPRKEHLDHLDRKYR